MTDKISALVEKLKENPENRFHRYNLAQAFFDSGEYSSNIGNGIRSETTGGQTMYGDYFEIDIQPNKVSLFQLDGPT